LRANGSRECAPDDRLREALHLIASKNGLLRRFAPRNDVDSTPPYFAVVTRGSAEWPPDDRLRRVIQYAAALNSIIDVSGILGHPLSRVTTLDMCSRSRGALRPRFAS